MDIQPNILISKDDVGKEPLCCLPFPFSYRNLAHMVRVDKNIEKLSVLTSELKLKALTGDITFNRKCN